MRGLSGRRAVRWLRGVHAINAGLTLPTRGVARLCGRQWEWAVKHLPRTGSVRSRLPNGSWLRLRSEGDDWVSNQVFWRGWAGYEPGTSSLFYRLATTARTTLDVGAHVGFYALIAAHANSQGRVYAFEPLPYTMKRLLAHVDLNRLSNVECHELAVAGQEGEQEMFRPRGVDLPCRAGLSHDLLTHADSDMERLPVRATTLDRFCEQHSIEHVDLVKLDTEGSEAEILAGASRILERDRPDVVCEVLPGSSGRLLEQAILPDGYRFYLITGSGPQPRTQVEGHPVWLNYLLSCRPPTEIAS